MGLLRSKNPSCRELVGNQERAVVRYVQQRQASLTGDSPALGFAADVVRQADLDIELFFARAASARAALGTA